MKESDPWSVKQADENVQYLDSERQKKGQLNQKGINPSFAGGTEVKKQNNLPLIRINDE